MYIDEWYRIDLKREIYEEYIRKIEPLELLDVEILD